MRKSVVFPHSPPRALQQPELTWAGGWWGVRGAVAAAGGLSSNDPAAASRVAKQPGD